MPIEFSEMMPALERLQEMKPQLQMSAQSYADAYAHARSVGWTEAQLRKGGCPMPPRGFVGAKFEPETPPQSPTQGLSEWERNF